MAAQSASATPILYVLPPSHFCERARWALDRARIEYRERPCAVGLHTLVARRLGAQSSLPILDLGDELIQESGRILDWTGLGGGDPVLESRAEHVIGPLVRQYIYSAALGDPKSGVRDVLLDNVSGWQAPTGRAMWPVTRRLMAQGMNARPALVDSLERKLGEELDALDARIDGRDSFACGFGRADITVASLLGPLARPAERPIYARVKLPPNVEATFNAWASRPSLRWVVSTYSRYRNA